MSDLADVPRGGRDLTAYFEPWDARLSHWLGEEPSWRC